MSARWYRDVRAGTLMGTRPVVRAWEMTTTVTAPMFKGTVTYKVGSRCQDRPVHRLAFCCALTAVPRTASAEPPVAVGPAAPVHAA